MQTIQQIYICSFNLPISAPPLKVGRILLESLEDDDLYIELGQYLKGLDPDDLLKVHEAFMKEDSLETVRFIIDIAYLADTSRVCLDLFIDVVTNLESQ